VQEGRAIREGAAVAGGDAQAKGLEPDVITYNATTSACKKGGQWEKALQLLEEMRAKGLEPDVITYAAVIDG
jgi:pentatricopeptide repeat domain-containing protein 1